MRTLDRKPAQLFRFLQGGFLPCEDGPLEVTSMCHTDSCLISAGKVSYVSVDAMDTETALLGTWLPAQQLKEKPSEGCYYLSGWIFLWTCGLRLGSVWLCVAFLGSCTDLSCLCRRFSVSSETGDQSKDALVPEVCSFQLKWPKECPSQAFLPS